MTRWVVRWRWGRVGGADRLALLAAIAVRGAGLLTLGYAVVLVWSQFRYPGWSLLLATALAVDSVVVVLWWLRGRSLSPATLAVDLPVWAAALVLNAVLLAPDGLAGWTAFVFPYTVLVSLSLGLVCLTLAGTMVAGLSLALAQLVAVLAIRHQGLLAATYILPSYLINPVVGWYCARLLRDGAVELDRAEADAAREATAVATEQERLRHAWALHDRVLQTVESLARGVSIQDPVLRDRLVTEAAWLRRFVETGDADQHEDLAGELAAVVRAVSGADPGTEVELHDAGIRAASVDGLAPAGRAALVAATHQALAGMVGVAGNVAVRASQERDGVLVTILAGDATGTPNVSEVERAAATLAGVGGTLTMDPVPYLELWIPLRTPAEQR